jgi:hypothetical protein
VGSCQAGVLMPALTEVADLPCLDDTCWPVLVGPLFQAA